MERSTGNRQTAIGQPTTPTARQLVEQLLADDSPDFLRAIDSSGDLVGVYSVIDGTLTYRAGPKCVTGQKAWSYLVSDAGKTRISFEQVGPSRSGPFQNPSPTGTSQHVVKASATAQD